jgi:hypothetical protein
LGGGALMWIVALLYVLTLLGFALAPSFFSRPLFGLDIMTIAVFSAAMFIAGPALIALMWLSRAEIVAK